MKYVATFLGGILFAVLTAIPLTNFFYDLSECHRCMQATSGAHAISTGLMMKGLSEGKFPSQAEGVESLVPKYLDEVPSDPWGHKYQYAISETEHYICFNVWSFGSDNKPGGKKAHEEDFYAVTAAGNCLTKRLKIGR